MQAKSIRRLGVLSLLGVLAVGATALTLSDSSPTPCPGTIVCPQTNETICADRCPLTGENAEDCPGTVVCPLTGETICADRCPLGNTGGEAATTPAAPRPCCSTADD